MAGFDRQVLHRDLGAAVVHHLDHLGQPDQIPLVLHRAVAPPAVAIGDERWTAHRREDQVVATDDDVVFGIPRMQGELRRSLADLLLDELRRKEDTSLRLVDPDPRLAEQLDRPRLLEHHPLIAQDRQGGPMDLLLGLRRHDRDRLERILETAHSVAPPGGRARLQGSKRAAGRQAERATWARIAKQAPPRDTRRSPHLGLSAAGAESAEGGLPRPRGATSDRAGAPSGSSCAAGRDRCRRRWRWAASKPGR